MTQALPSTPSFSSVSMTTCLPLSWMQGKFFSCNDLSKMTEEECKCVCWGGGGSGAGAGSPSAGGTGGPESLGPERCSQRPPALGTEGRVPGPDLPCFRMLIALTQRRR